MLKDKIVTLSRAYFLFFSFVFFSSWSVLKVRDEEMLRKEALLIKPGKETKPLKKIFSDDPVKEYDDARRRRRRQTTAQGEVPSFDNTLSPRNLS